MEPKSLLNTIFEDAAKIISNPAEFYRNMAKTGGIVDPLIYLVVMAAIGGLFVGILSMAGFGLVGGVTTGLGAVIFFPIIAVIGSFISSAVMFVIWKLMGSGETFETAYRCVAYAGAIYPVSLVLGMVPYLGSVVGVAWGMYLMILASVEAHKLNQKTSYLVFGILGAVLVFVNLSGEIAARNMASKFEGLGRQMERSIEKSGEMTPGEAGKAVGEFLKGLESGTKQLESESDDPMGRNSEDRQANKKEITPEEAGKVLGEFFKGMEQATQKNDSSTE
jgi:Sec-independent protein translocase protein TatA